MWSGRAPILLEEFEESFLARGELSTRGWEDLLKKPDLLSHGSSIEQIFMCFSNKDSYVMNHETSFFMRRASFFSFKQQTSFFCLCFPLRKHGVPYHSSWDSGTRVSRLLGCWKQNLNLNQRWCLRTDVGNPAENLILRISNILSQMVDAYVMRNECVMFNLDISLPLWWINLKHTACEQCCSVLRCSAEPRMIGLRETTTRGRCRKSSALSFAEGRAEGEEAVPLVGGEMFMTGSSGLHFDSCSHGYASLRML